MTMSFRNLPPSSISIGAGTPAVSPGVWPVVLRGAHRVLPSLLRLIVAPSPDDRTSKPRAGCPASDGSRAHLRPTDPQVPPSGAITSVATLWESPFTEEALALAGRCPPLDLVMRGRRAEDRIRFGNGWADRG